MAPIAAASFMVDVFALVSLVWSVIMMTSEAGKIEKGQVSNERLTGLEKFAILFMTTFSPVITGVIFYYGWRRVLPAKAKAANLLSFLGLVLFFVVRIALVKILG